MFTTGWAAPRRRSACRTADVLALKAHNLDATIFGPRPKFRRPYPSGIANSARHRRSPKGRARWTLRLLEYEVVEHHLLHPLQELARLPEDIAQQF